jgi:hypothetical protein
MVSAIVVARVVMLVALAVSVGRVVVWSVSGGV